MFGFLLRASEIANFSLSILTSSSKLAFLTLHTFKCFIRLGFVVIDFLQNSQLILISNFIILGSSEPHFVFLFIPLSMLRKVSEKSQKVSESLRNILVDV